MGLIASKETIYIFKVHLILGSDLNKTKLEMKYLSLKVYVAV